VADKAAGIIYCYVDDVFVNTVDLASYNGDNLGFFSIEHDTYVLNRDIVVEELPDTDESTIEKVTHVNVTSALNYGETVTVIITKTDGTRHPVSYTVPDLGTTEPDYDTADKARATKEVAYQLMLAIEAQVVGIDAENLGSTVGIWEAGKANWIQVEVESGQGERSTVAINKVIESTVGLPLYAVVGTRITVRPDPTTDKGTYYLQAERIADVPSGEFLEEVVWSEDRSPTETHSFNNATMPHKITYDGTFTLNQINFRSRQSGDSNSTPFPEFLGKTIQTMGYFQKRLVAVSENAAYMTETDDLLNWFRQSAVNLLVTDPIGVTTSELGADKILHLVPHNKDLLCITRNSQFKISGSVAITPETVSMPLTTKYECQVSVPPASIGNSVYFPIDYGDSTGIQEYTGEKDTNQDFAAPVTNHIIGYLKGNAEILVSSPNLEMIAMTTSESPDNTVFIYEQYTESSGKRSQQSWSEWNFADNERVVDLKFRRNELVVLVAKGNNLIIKTIPMYTRVTTSPLDVYLDDLLDLPTDGLTVEVPAEYDMTNCIVVRGEGTKNELWKALYTLDGNTVTFKEDIGAGRVYIGREFRSEYEPTRPFRYDEDGSTITTDKIRVGRWVLSLVDTHELSMTKLSTYGNDTTLTFESRFMGQFALGSIKAYTGDWKFSFAEDAALARAVFFVDNYLGCTISDVSWEGQYFQSKQRMK
jgi:hypothetical protein